MEDGLLNKPNIGVIIQARMSSKRLPGKVLMPLPFDSGKPLLQHIVNQAKLCKPISKIVVATSDQPENNQLEKFCNSNSIPVFRGSENDVLSRFIQITKIEKFDVVIRLTADNPFLDLSTLEKTISIHLRNKNDYTKTQGLPLGMNFEIIDAKKLVQLEGKNLSSAEKEHVTLFLSNHDNYKTEVVTFRNKKGISDLRLTIDYGSDFLLVSLLFSQLLKEEQPNLKFITRIFMKYPWLFMANENNFQL